MKKLYRLLSLLAIFLLPAHGWAQTLTTTVADGTTTDAYIPVYGYYIDEAQHNQVIYPADMLEELTGATISGMTFYMSQTASSAWVTTVTLSLGTTENTTLSSLDNSTALTQVWQGVWNGQDQAIEVEFDEPFVFEGPNLLLDIQTTVGTYSSASFYGVSATNASRYSYGYSGNNRNFIPKTTFTYTAGSGNICYRPKNLVVSDITSDGATISWTTPNVEGQNYIVFVNGEEYDTPADTFSVVSGLEANTTYTVKVRNFCGDGDTSGALTGTFRTACANGSCEIEVSTSSSSYGYADIHQNGSLLQSVNNGTVSICSQDSLVVLFHSGNYGSSATITVVDVAGTQLANFSGSGHSTGDTVLAVANGCPSCMPVTDLHISDADTDFFTVAWTGHDNDAGYVVYIDSVEATDYDGVSTEYTLAGLTNSNRHEVWVRADCDDNDTSAWRKMSASASCSHVHISADDNAEFLETMAGIDGSFGGTVSASADHTASQALLPCWYFSDNYVWPKSGEITIESGHASSYLCLPVMDAPINTLEITWTGKIGNVGDYPDSVVLGVADFSGEIVEWYDTLFYNQQSRADWVNHPWYNFENYQGTGVRIAFKVLFSTNWNSFHNFRVRQIPQCTAPANLVGHNYTDADSTYYTWTPQGSAEEWQVAVGTPGDDPDALSYSTTDVPSFVIPSGTLTLGQLYTIWVRANCGDTQSEWISHTFHSGTVIMPASGTDTVDGCSLVIYDDGYQGPYASGSHTSTLVVRPNVDGNIVVVDSLWFRNYTYQGTSMGELTIYDGEGTSGAVLFESSVYADVADALVGEEGPITIVLQGGQYAGAGFEIYTHCIAGATCFRPKHVAVTAQATEATVTWDNGNAVTSGGEYVIYYRAQGTDEWQTTTGSEETTAIITGLSDNTIYEVRVQGACSSTDSSVISQTTTFRTACPGDICTLTVSLENYSSATVLQNGYAFDTYSNSYYSSTNTVQVCSDYQLDLMVSGDVVVTNVADIEIYNSATSTASGDTIHAGLPCPTCMPVTGFAASDITADGATVSWTAGSEETQWVVYLDGEQQADPVSSASATFSGLAANTAYTVGVRALCGDEDTSVLRTFQFRTACSGGNCDFTVEARDSYGDGWNGAAIQAYQNGSLVESLTLANSSSSQTFNVSHCLGDSIVLRWLGGSYDGECGFTILASTGDTVLNIVGYGTSSTAPMTNGMTIAVFDEDCAGTALMQSNDTGDPGTDCNAPTNLAASAVTQTGATITWNPGSTGDDFWQVEFEGEIENVESTTYTLSDLEPGTQYTFSVSTICDDYDYSDAATITFTTLADGPTPCDAVTGVNATADVNSITLTWDDATDAFEVAIVTGSSWSNPTAESATGSSHTFTGLSLNTEYTVGVRRVCSEGNASAWVTRTVTTTGVGIDNVEFGNSNFELYPNPATSEVTISVKDYEGQHSRLEVLTLSGQVVDQFEIHNSKFTIDITSLPAGAYFLRLTSEDSTAVRKLIVR